MRLAFPESLIRQVDVAVGAALWLWNLTQLAASPWLAAMQPRMLHLVLYRRIAAFLVLDFLLWSVACLSVARGRRWGFMAMAFLLVLGTLGLATRLLANLPRPSLGDVVPPALGATALVYCLARFSAQRPAPKYPRAFR